MSDDDPVRARRQQFDRAGALLRQAGWACIGVAVVAFVAGFFVGFGVAGTVAAAGLVLSCFTLAPGIVLGYAVKKAEREDPGPD